jgi:hypothetical protein
MSIYNHDDACDLRSPIVSATPECVGANAVTYGSFVISFNLSNRGSRQCRLRMHGGMDVTFDDVMVQSISLSTLLRHVSGLILCFDWASAPVCPSHGRWPAAETPERRRQGPEQAGSGPVIHAGRGGTFQANSH